MAKSWYFCILYNFKHISFLYLHFYKNLTPAGIRASGAGCRAAAGPMIFRALLGKGPWSGRAWPRKMTSEIWLAVCLSMVSRENDGDEEVRFPKRKWWPLKWPFVARKSCGRLGGLLDRRSASSHRLCLAVHVQRIGWWYCRRASVRRVGQGTLQRWGRSDFVEVTGERRTVQTKWESASSSVPHRFCGQTGPGEHTPVVEDMLDT